MKIWLPNNEGSIIFLPNLLNLLCQVQLKVQLTERPYKRVDSLI